MDRIHTFINPWIKSKKKIVAIILVLSLCLFLCFPKKKEITLTQTQKQDMDRYFTKEEIKKNLFGILEIPNLQLKNPIYNKGEKENQVDKNIQLLEETITKDLKSNVIVLASHSGNGIHAYFKNLHQIKENDPIYFHHQEKKLEYRFFKMEEVEKTGTIYLEHYEFPCLILITCSKEKENIQEVYYAKFIKNMT